MNTIEISQFNKVCNILKSSQVITDVENTDKNIKVFVNDVGVVIDKGTSTKDTYKTLTRFLNLLRK